jgi:hypothetical protein
MNKILEKAITELKKEDFKKDYVLGMLETLVEMQSAPQVEHKIVPPKIIPSLGTDPIPEKQVTEAEMLEKLAAAKLKEVQEMSTIDEIREK